MPPTPSKDKDKEKEPPRETTVTKEFFKKLPTPTKTNRKQTKIARSFWYHVCKQFEEGLGDRWQNQADYLRHADCPHELSLLNAGAFQYQMIEYRKGRLDPHDDRSRNRARPYFAIEAKVVSWIRMAIFFHRRLTYDMVQTKARAWAADLDFHDFKGSNGWLIKLLRRNKLTIPDSGERLPVESASCVCWNDLERTFVDATVFLQDARVQSAEQAALVESMRSHMLHATALLQQLTTGAAEAPTVPNLQPVSVHAPTPEGRRRGKPKNPEEPNQVAAAAAAAAPAAPAFVSGITMDRTVPTAAAAVAPAMPATTETVAAATAPAAVATAPAMPAATAPLAAAAAAVTTTTTTTEKQPPPQENPGAPAWMQFMGPTTGEIGNGAVAMRPL